MQFMLGLMVNDSTLAGLLSTSTPIRTIFTGPVDIVKETQTSLKVPLVTLSAVSEVYRTVPIQAKDSRISIDIYSRNSELQVENIYERITTLLNYQQGNSNTNWIAWQRVGGLSSQYDSDARMWHWTVDFTVWSVV